VSFSFFFTDTMSTEFYILSLHDALPICVFQVLKRHFARYTPEIVERYCGVPKEVFLNVAETFTSASGPEKTGAICYALGWTQHRSEEHTSELQSRFDLVCRLLLEKKKNR